MRIITSILIFCLAFVQASAYQFMRSFGRPLALWVTRSPLGRFMYARLVLCIVANELSNIVPQSLITQYDKRFIPNLKARLQHYRCAERRKMEMNAGNALRLFMYNTLGPNLVQASEGMSGLGRTIAVSFNTTTIGEYADSISLSKYVSWTSLDDAIVNIRTELAYAFGQTIATIVKNTADGWNAIDSAANTAKAANSPLVTTDITNAVQGMLGRNIEPFDQAKQEFCGVVHPFPVGDFINDKSNNSFTDVVKHTVEGQMKLEELPGPDEVNAMHWGGAQFYQSTLVTTTANYQSSGKTGYRTYLYGQNGVIALSLGPDSIGDGQTQNLKLVLEKTEATSVADQEGMIGGWTSYRTMFACATPPDTVMRGRTIDANSNVT